MIIMYTMCYSMSNTYYYTQTIIILLLPHIIIMHDVICARMYELCARASEKFNVRYYGTKGLEDGLSEEKSEGHQNQKVFYMGKHTKRVFPHQCNYIFLFS